MSEDERDVVDPVEDTESNGAQDDLKAEEQSAEEQTGEDIEKDGEGASVAEEEAAAAKAEEARLEAEAEEAAAAQKAEEERLEAEAAAKAEEEAAAAAQKAEEEAAAAKAEEERLEAEAAAKAAEEEAAAAKAEEERLEAEAAAAKAAEEEAAAAAQKAEEEAAAAKAAEEAAAAQKAEEEAAAAKAAEEEAAAAAQKAEEEAAAAKAAEEAAQKAEEEAAAAAQKAEEEAAAAKAEEERLEAEAAAKAAEEEAAAAAQKAEEEAAAAKAAEEAAAAQKAEEEAAAAKAAEEEAAAAAQKAEEEAAAAKAAEEAAQKAEQEAAEAKAAEEAAAAQKAEEEAAAKAEEERLEAEAAAKAEEEAAAAKAAEEAAAAAKAEEEAAAAKAEEEAAAAKAEEERLEAEAAAKAAEEAAAAQKAEEEAAAAKAAEEEAAAQKAAEAAAEEKAEQEAAEAAHREAAAAEVRKAEEIQKAAQAAAAAVAPTHAGNTQAGDPFLQLLSPPADVQIPLENGRTTFGSGNNAVHHARLCGEGVEATHCSIEVNRGELSLRLGTKTAELYVNGTRMDPSVNANGVLLSSGDRLIFGSSDTLVYGVENPIDDDASLPEDEALPSQPKPSFEGAIAERNAKRSVQSPSNDNSVNSMHRTPSYPSGVPLQNTADRVGVSKLMGATNLSSTAGSASPKSRFADPVSNQMKQVDVGLFTSTRKQVARVPPQLLRKYKVILIGHEEVGKTSLKKCWQSDPRFFKKLPEVMCTTGIEVQDHNLRYEGHGAGKKSDDDLTLSVLDFAGQEVYHSHSLFLSRRTVFCFVWNMADTDDGEMSEVEDRRMMGWLDEVYSKAPGSSAILVGTHKDELPNQNLTYVNDVLRKVRARFETYIESIRMNDDPSMTITVAGSYGVSCKTRQAWGGGFQTDKGAKMSELLRAIGQVAFNNCLADRQFPSGAVPGRHVQFLKELERIKTERKKLLLSIQEYAQLAADFGIEVANELSDCTMLFHCWNVIYVFTQSKRLLDNQYIFLHPLWLSHMVSALFSFAHLMYTPPPVRKYIGGLDFAPHVALKADAGELRSGKLSMDLLRVVLSKSIKQIRNERQEHPLNHGDLEMCVQLLVSMDLIFKQGPTTFYVPSLFPYSIPAQLKETAPYMFQKGVSRMYLFNIFPKEFYYRLVCRLHHLLVPLSVQVGANMAPDFGEDAQYLPPDYAYELRNYWKDGAWFGAEGVRALMYQEDTMIYAHFISTPTAGKDPLSDCQYDETLQEFARYFHTTIKTLSQEYDGLSMSSCQPCLEVCTFFF